LFQEKLTGFRYHVSSRAYDGYTLFAPLGGPGVWLIDMEGNFVHHWDVEHGAGPHGVLLPNGNLLFAGATPDNPIADLGGGGGELLEIDWNGNVVWRYDDPYMHHDFQRLANGNTMILRWVKTPRDISARVKGGMPGTEMDGELWSDCFREITPGGEIVWEFKEDLALKYYSSFISGCQRLPNGNTLICEGTLGRFIEVTPDKEVVWEYISPFYNRKIPWLGLANLVFRAHRYGPDYPGLKGKDLTPGRLELVAKEKDKEEKVIRRRLAGLGY